MKNFALNQYAERAENLLTQAKKAFSEMGIPSEALPQNMQPDEGAIKLVFVGQYSSGKSSIIKMLSGIETDIGASITTQKAKSYDWNGMEIVDTPGIHTELRPDHDEITYDEIGHAALLVFVVTSEGFSHHIGEHFRKLAIEQKRASNMVLVVNKMDRTEGGNSPAQQKILLPDICQVIEPCKPEELYLSFLSTHSYEESLVEKDEEIRQELLEESGHDTFVENLNAFVRAKKVSARLQRPLYTLEASLRSAIGAPEDTEALNGVEELTKRRLRILDDAEKDCIAEIQDLALNCQQDIQQTGREAAHILEQASSEEGAKAALQKAVETAQKRADVCNEAIVDAIRSLADNIEKETTKELSSPFAQQIIELNDRALSLRDEAAQEDDGNDAGSKLQALGGMLLGNSIKAKDLSKLTSAAMPAWEITKVNLTSFSGSFMHEVVTKVGHGLGIKFAPYGALKFLKGLNIAFAVIGVLFTLYDAVTAGSKQKEREQKLRAAKEDIRQNFNAEAQKVYSSLMASAREKVRALTASEHDSLNETLQKVAQQRSLAAQRQEKLSGLLDAEQKLMEEIEAARS